MRLIPFPITEQYSMTIVSNTPYWTPTSAPDAERRLRECVSVLAKEPQRAILRVLKDHSQPLSTADLVTQLCAIEQNTPMIDLTPEETKQTQISLTHVHLPQLEATGFVSTSRDTAMVQLSNHPLLDDPQFEHLIARETSTWDDGLTQLTSNRHRIICAILADHATPLSCERLALLVAARELIPDSTPVPVATDPPAAVRQTVLAALYHIHLPKLAAADLIAYDSDAGTVAYRSHPSLDTAWLDADWPAIADESTYLVDLSTDDGVAVHIAVSPDGQVENAYTSGFDDLIRQTIAVSPSGETVSTPPRLDPAAIRRRETQLIDCWRRHNTAS